MANLKNITELPVAESAEGLNLIVNDGGAAKQIAASEVGAQADWTETDENNPAYIKNKPHRELMYEWNFEADPNPDNGVWELYENVDEDLCWLTDPTEDTDWEIEVSQYSYREYWDEDAECYYYIVGDFGYTTCVNINKNYIGFHNDTSIQLNTWARCIESFPVGVNCWDNCCYLYAYNNKQLNFENGGFDSTQQGGAFIIEAEGGPFKSIKIYKVYR